ncbi:ATP-dependent RNA helicase DBP5 [Umbelopsis sp. PMI_123]|nr:ATP-dependent RNA helicase DBP5 [Umbelopsis sp. PMI_123]
MHNVYFPCALYSISMHSLPLLSSAVDDNISNLVESSHVVQVKLADLQANPDSPLYSAKSFDQLGLKPELLKGLYNMKFTRPSKIQERALPLLLANPPRNMIGQSQSGTGKTAAFVLTMLSRIDPSIKAPQAICLAPTRELVRQILDVATQMGKFTNISMAVAVKDTYKRNMKMDAQLIVGTPGTTMDLTQRRQLDSRHVRIFVLDEADNMLDQNGLGDHSIRVKNMMPKDCQVVLFSATFPEIVRSFAVRFAPNANEISLRQEELSVDGIKQFYMDCNSEEHKYEVLCSLYNLLTISQSIIFCRRKDTADEIARRMTADGHSVVSLHGSLDSEERDAVMDAFREGHSKVLITTNVVARGIDILQVTLVINYDMPLTRDGKPDAETYLHRIGRTGRFGRTGVSINFVHDHDSWKQMRELESIFQRPITMVPTDDWEEVEKLLKKAI